MWEFTLTSPENGVASSAIVYFQNTTGKASNLQIGWEQSGNDYTFNDRIFWYSSSVQSL